MKRTFHSENEVYPERVKVQRKITSMFNVDAPKLLQVTFSRL